MVLPQFFKCFQFTHLLNLCHLTSFVNQRSQTEPQEIEKVCCEWDVSCVKWQKFQVGVCISVLMRGVRAFLETGS